jgi:peptidoglycan/xylan/chitin deacetylase (PgdA/CDA1 family)
MIMRIKRKLRSWQSCLLKGYHHALYGSCRVLLYHRVTDLETDPQLLAVSPANFDDHLEYLSSACHVLAIAEFEDILRNRKRFPANAILITFDDGYADNYLEALPILEKHKLQALFYVSTGTLGTGEEYWWDAIERIVLLSDQPPSQNEIEVNGEVFSLGSLDDGARTKLYESLLPRLRRMPSEPRDKIIRKLAVIFGSEQPRETHRAMTHEELSKMAESRSAVVGAHTHLHPSLGALNYQDQADEIRQSNEILEKELQRPLRHFSYPFGTVHDFNEDTLCIVREQGFAFVAANYPDVVNKQSDSLRFPRFLVRDWGVDEFKRQLKSFV